jgi:uncharacterized protein YbjT (DUF2867 family)
MYAVTGITGKVGGAVARTLLSAGQQLRAVVRDAKKGNPGPIAAAKGQMSKDG